jgi:UDP:flavonoid glycosyltransferase YjiC (YdhE family)
MSRRVAWSGVGTGLRTGASQQARIARAVGDVTARPAVRAGAGELGTAPTAAGGAHPTTDLLAASLTG